MSSALELGSVVVLQVRLILASSLSDGLSSFVFRESKFYNCRDGPIHVRKSSPKEEPTVRKILSNANRKGPSSAKSYGQTGDFERHSRRLRMAAWQDDTGSLQSARYAHRSVPTPGKTAMFRGNSRKPTSWTNGAGTLMIGAVHLNGHPSAPVA